MYTNVFILIFTGFYFFRWLLGLGGGGEATLKK